MPASAADVQLASSFPADKATLIPLGDINGDERGDVIASVRDVVATQQDLAATPKYAHPHQAAGPSFARIHLGGVGEQTQPDGTKSVTLNANTLTLQLPAPLLTDSFGARSQITTGDLNGDGLSDIVVMVHTELPAQLQAQGRPLFPGEGIYVLYGRSDWGTNPIIDVTTQSDVIFTGIGRPTSIVSPGNVIGDTPGPADLLIGQIAPLGPPVTDNLLLAGGPRTAAPWNESGVLFHAGFESGLDDFVINNQPLSAADQPVAGLWHRSTGRSSDPLHGGDSSLYFGRNEKLAGGGNYAVGDTAGTLTKTVTLPRAVSNLELSFNSLLHTEGDPASADQAQVLVSVNGSQFNVVAQNVLNNSSGGSEAVLLDSVFLPVEETRNWVHTSLSLGALLAGDTIAIRFQFDTVDQFDGTAHPGPYEGWYLDDIELRSTTNLSSLSSPALTRLQVPGSQAFVAATGAADWDNNASTRDGLAIVSFTSGSESKLYLLEGRNSFASATVDLNAVGGADRTLTLEASLDVPVVLPSGDLDGDDSGDLFVRTLQTVVTTAPQTTIVYSKGGTLDTAKVAAALVPLGDVDGDGKVRGDGKHIAEVALATTENTDRLAEDGIQLKHGVFNVFFSPSDGLRTQAVWDALTNGTTKPTAVLEPARTQFGISTETTLPDVRSLVRLGDLNNDNRGDFGLVDALGSDTHVFFGRAIETVTFATATSQAPEEFPFTLSTPRLDIARPRTTLDINAGNGHDILQTSRVEGHSDREYLSQTQSIGDFNGDHYEDFLVSGLTFAYVLLGPVKLDAIDDIGSRAEIRIDLKDGWKPAIHRGQVGGGDANGDRTDDLFFYRVTPFGEGIVFQVNVLPGTTRPMRDYSVTTDSKIVVSLSATVGPIQGDVGQFATAQLFDYDDDDIVDLLVADEVVPVIGGRAGLVFVGRRSVGNPSFDLESRLMDNPQPAVLGDTDAVADIQYSPLDLLSTELSLLKDQFLGAQSGEYESAKPYEDDNNVNNFTILHAAIADLDADGRDDVLFNVPAEVKFQPKDNKEIPAFNLGTTYVFAAQTVQAITAQATLDSSEVLVRGLGRNVAAFDVAAPVFGLGDVNRDGFDDFALVRSYEANSFGEARVLVYFGGTALFSSKPLTTDDADIALRLFDRDTLPPGTFVLGNLFPFPIGHSLTTGDFDNDDRLDLALGQPFSLVCQENGQGGFDFVDHVDRGQVHVVWNVAGLGREIVLDQAPADLDGDGRIDVLRLEGAFDSDLFGSLSRTNGIDADRDGYDDLLIGAPLADALRTEVVDQAGAIYAVYGTPRRVPLPEEDVVIELANRTFTGIGDVLVDSGTGRPEEFSTDDHGVPLALPKPTTQQTLDGETPQRWFRFRMVGDGKPGDDVLRLLPFAYDERVVTLDGIAGHQNPDATIEDGDDYSVGGFGNRTGVLDFDLSRLLEAYDNADAIDKVELALDADVGVQPISSPKESVVAGSRLFFTASTPETGTELFVSDGTAAGTDLVKDLVPGLLGSNPQQLTAVGNNVFFTLVDPNVANVVQLWFSDGTAMGTRRINTFTDTSRTFTAISNPVAFQDGLFFIGETSDRPQLFASKEVTAGNWQIEPISDPLDVLSIPHIAVMDPTRLFFSVDSGGVYQLWTSDGMAGPTHTKSLQNFMQDSKYTLLQQAIGFNGNLYFAARVSGPNGVELWRSDGTTTELVADLKTGNFSIGVPNSSVPKAFAVATDPLGSQRLFFIANGGEVWTTDGNATFYVNKIVDPFNSVPPREPLSVTTSDNRIVFAICDTFSKTTFSTLSFAANGTPSLTQFLSLPTVEFRSLTAFGNNVVFVGEVPASGGTPASAKVILSDGRLGRGQSFQLANSSDVDAPDLFRVLNGKLHFRNVSSVPGETELFVTDGQPSHTQPLLDVGSVTTTLNVTRLNGEQDGVVTGHDFLAPGTAAGSQSVTTGAGYQPIVVDVTAQVRQALLEHRRHVTLRLQVADPSVRLLVNQPDPTSASNPTGLRVTYRHGVRADLLDANGGVLEEGIASLDLRNQKAGTYYLRVFNPDALDAAQSQTTPLNFTIQIDAPIQGYAHPALDNDVIEGGGGEDILVGNEHLDRLYGESGDDTFLAERVEVRDHDPVDEPLRPVDASEALASNPPKILDPIVMVTDGVLRRVLGKALNVPLLDNGEFAVDVFATDLAKLPFLDASDAGIILIEDLAGLEYATNLVGLNLSGNLVSNLDQLEPGLSDGDAETFPQFVGPRLLRYLNLDRNPISDQLTDKENQLIPQLSALSLLTELRVLSINDTFGQEFSLSDVSGLGALRNSPLTYLSLANNTIVDVSPLAKLPSLEVLDLSRNNIADIGTLAGAFVIDDDNPSAGYSEAGAKWSGNQQSVTTAFRGDYRRQFVGDANGTATWTFGDLPSTSFDVFATWHAHEGQATNAFYVVDGASDPKELSVNQRFDPLSDLTVDGRPFQKLGTFTPDTMTGKILVSLQDQSSAIVPLPSDGTVVADAVVIRAHDLPLPKLQRLDLHHNPLGNDALDLAIPVLQQRLLGSTEFTFDANHAPIADGVVGPQAGSVSGTTVTVNGVRNMLDLSDPDSDWLLVGDGDSSEILRFGGPDQDGPIGRQLQFSATGLPAAIPDASSGIPGVRTSSIVIAGIDGTIQDVDVEFDITHSYDGDLVTILTGPNGSQVTLFNQAGGGGDDFTSTTLDDEAPADTPSTAPFTGSFRPQVGLLSVFDGLSPNGTWTLTVRDVASADTGSLNRFQLTFVVPNATSLTATAPAPGVFAETFTQTKQPGETGTRTLTGGAYGRDGNLYVTDASTHSVSLYHGATGAFIARHEFASDFTPRDIAINPDPLDGSVYVAGFLPSSQGKVLKLSSDLGGTPANVVIGPTLSGAPDVALDFGEPNQLYIAWSTINGTPTDNVQRFNTNPLTGGLTNLIPAFELNLSAPRDIAVTSDGTIYLVDVFDNNSDGAFDSRVLRYNANGLFRQELIAPTLLDNAHLDRRPRLELGPDDRLYLSDPVSGKVNRHDRFTGTLLSNPDPFLNTTGVHVTSPSFLAFAQNRPLNFEVLTNNPAVTGQMLANGNLQLNRPVGFSGSVAVTVRAWDGPADIHDFNGRFAETRFEVNILSSTSNALYGTVFDDLNQNQFQEPGEPGLENIKVYLDANNNDLFEASESFVRTDANGDYSFVGLNEDTYHIRELADANSSVLRGTRSIIVNSGMFTSADLANFVEVDAGPDRKINEGSVVNLPASVRRPNLTYSWNVTGVEVANPSGETTANFSFVPLDDGQATVSVRVTDPDSGETFTDVVDVFVQPVSPTIEAGIDIAINVGDTFTRVLTINDPGADAWTVTVDYGDETSASFVTSDRSFTLNHTYPERGTFTVEVGVQAAGENLAVDQFQVTVGNLLPQVALTPGPAINEAGTASLGVTITDPTCSFVDYQLFQVNWGDGTTQPFTVQFTEGSSTATANLTHVYADNLPADAASPITVTVRGETHGVLDQNMQPINDETVASTSIIIHNVAPTIGTTTVPTTLSEGQFATFSAAASDPAGSGDPLQFVWDFGDGSSPVTGTTVSKAFADNGSYQVTLTVRDDDLAAASKTFTVVVTNVAPTVTPIAKQTVSEGTLLSLTDIGTFTDPGPEAGGTFTFSINWGDGSSPSTGTATVDQAGTVLLPLQGSFNGSHTYGNDGTYLVTLQVTDKDAGIGAAQFNVIVTNVAPTVTPIGNQSVAEGQALSLTDIATFSDPEFGVGTAFVFAIDWGDGSALDTGTATIDVAGAPGQLTQGSFDGSHTYADNGTYTVTLRVTDNAGLGARGFATFQVAVNNLNPILTIGAVPNPIVGGQLVTLTGTYDDVPADRADVAVLIDFGDGTPRRQAQRGVGSGGILQFEFRHVFTAPGLQTVTVIAEDDDQGQTTQEVSLNVVAADILMQNAVANGSTLTVTYNIADMPVDPFTLGVFRSTDALFDPATKDTRGDLFLDQVQLTDPADLSVGLHTKTFTIGPAVGDISLPGVERPEIDGDYHLLVVADPQNAIVESDPKGASGPLNEDNTASVSGLYQGSNPAQVFIHGTLDSDAIVAQSGGTMLNINGTQFTLPNGSIASIHLRAHAGDDLINLAMLTAPTLADGGEGNDVFAGFDASKTWRGGVGTDTLRLPGSGQALDLTAIDNALLTELEIIDLTGSGPNSLILNAGEVLNLRSDSNTLRVLRDLGDTVLIGNGWTPQDNQTIDGNVFKVFTQGAATLQVQPLGLAITSPGSVNVSENTTAVVTVAASDGGLPIPMLNFSLTGGADQARFSINATTGVLKFQTAPDFENPADADLDNIYDVNVTASNGTSTTSQTLHVSVSGVNEHNPVITSSNTISLPENQSNVLTLAATDADLPAPTISFSLIGGADQNKFSLTSTGVLSFQSPPDFESPTDADANNVYAVIVQADDGTGGSTTQSISITVSDVFEVPDIVIRSAVADGSLTPAGRPRMTVVYEVLKTTLLSALSLQVLKSTDALANLGVGGDTALGSAITLSGPADRSVGLHTIQLTIGTVADVGTRGAIPLPGVSAAETDLTDYHILVVADPANTINEVDADPLNEDNTQALVGAYRPTATATQIFVQGGAAADTISVNYPATTSGMLAVSLAGAFSQTYQFLYSSTATAQFRIRSNGGNDTVGTQNPANLTARPMFVLGGSGDDLLTGAAGSDTLNGGSDNDKLAGGAGSDSLIGELGDDVYMFVAATSAETDTVKELIGEGTDRLDFSALSSSCPVTLDLSSTATSLSVHLNRKLAFTAPTIANNFEEVIGGEGNDTFTGGNANNRLEGRGGNDILNGGGGDDALLGGVGDDAYLFKAPLSALTTETDLVSELPAEGIDRLDFSTLLATVAVTVNLNNDAELASHGPSTNPHNRNVIAGTGQAANFENVMGGAGNDLLTGNSADNRLEGGAGDDMLNGADNQDILLGGRGSDHMFGGAGDDVYLFQNGLTAAEIDTLTEVSGIDRLDFSLVTAATTNVTVDLSSSSASQDVHGTGTSKRTLAFSPSDFENVTGGAGKDTLTGNGLVNRLEGGGSDDKLAGGGSNDVLSGGLGNDNLDGGTGSNTLVESAPTATATNFTLTNTSLAGVGTDVLANLQAANLTGSANKDTFTVSGWTGTGQLIGGGGIGDMIVAAKNGSFTLSNTSLQTTDGMIVSLSSITIATLTGGAGNDTFALSDWTGTGTLDGGAGTDLLIVVRDVTLTTLTNTSLVSAGFGALTLKNNSLETAQLSGGDTANKIFANQFTLGPVILQGAGGDDILIGGAKKDSLEGGTGRDLLIGGQETDSINGGADEDILIGGMTSFSPLAAAAKLTEFTAIMAEWTKTGVGNGYADRVTRIRDTGVLNGTVKLNTSTVQDDANAVDHLIGGNLNASDIDWFFIKSLNEALDAIDTEIKTQLL